MGKIDNLFKTEAESEKETTEPEYDEYSVDYYGNRFKTLSSLKVGDDVYTVGRFADSFNVCKVLEVSRLKSGTLRLIITGTYKHRLLLKDGEMWNGKRTYSPIGSCTLINVTADIDVFKRELEAKMKEFDKELHTLMEIYTGFNEDYKIGSYDK